jgi:hypothetical protein
MNKISKSALAIFICITINPCSAQPLEQISSYVPETSRLINQTTIQANNAIRKIQKSDDLKIPKDWRLVSVTTVFKSNSNDQEFVLFFQDSKSNVHTLEIAASGLVSGRKIMTIKASE